jgi:hypothetical protein
LRSDTGVTLGRLDQGVREGLAGGEVLETGLAERGV